MVRSVIVSGFGERWGVGSHDGKMCVCFPFSFLRRVGGDGGKEKLNGGRCDCDFVIFFFFTGFRFQNIAKLSRTRCTDRKRRAGGGWGGECVEV